MPTEQEVMLPPNMLFRINAEEKYGRKEMVQMTEIVR
jgi:hypothetical protein